MLFHNLTAQTLETKPVRPDRRKAYALMIRWTGKYTYVKGTPNETHLNFVANLVV